jgi:hypothetical protein
MRLLTIFIIVGTCTVTMFHGWNVASFAQARMQLANTRGAESAGLAKWIGSPGVTAAALEASLPKMADATDIEGARHRERQLEAIAAVRPLSASTWLALAGLRLVTGAPRQQVLGALAMSSIAGPNEGRVMWQRGVFGLLQWEELPQDARQRTITDLSGALGTSIEDPNLSPAKNILSEKPAETRQDIAALLRSSGVPASEISRLGL